MPGLCSFFLHYISRTNERISINQRKELNVYLHREVERKHNQELGGHLFRVL